MGVPESEFGRYGFIRGPLYRIIKPVVDEDLRCKKISSSFVRNLTGDGRFIWMRSTVSMMWLHY